MSSGTSNKNLGIFSWVSLALRSVLSSQLLLIWYGISIFLTAKVKVEREFTVELIFS